MSESKPPVQSVSVPVRCLTYLIGALLGAGLGAVIVLAAIGAFFDVSLLVVLFACLVLIGAVVTAIDP